MIVSPDRYQEDHKIIEFQDKLILVSGSMQKFYFRKSPLPSCRSRIATVLDDLDGLLDRPLGVARTEKHQGCPERCGGCIYSILR